MYRQVKKHVSTHHCREKFQTRVIYNSAFRHTDLFDPDVRKSLCSLPVVRKKLYSDVVRNVSLKNPNCLQKGTVVFRGTKKPYMGTRTQDYCVDNSCKKRQKKRSVHRGRVTKFGSFNVQTANKFHVLQNHVDCEEQQVEHIVPNGNTVLREKSKTKVKKSTAMKVHSYSFCQPKMVKNMPNRNQKMAFDATKVSKNAHVVDCHHAPQPQVGDSKYDLGLITIKNKVEKLKKAKELPSNSLFFRQNKGNFGFIPCSKLPTKIVDKSSEHNFDFATLHKKVLESGKPNYLGVQLPVPSKLNAKKFFEYSTDYWDWQLPFFIKFGFPLDIDHPENITSEKLNHKSALDHPDHVDHYISEYHHFHCILPLFSPEISPVLKRNV